MLFIYRAAVVAALIGCASAHFTFTDMRSQIACDRKAKVGPNWLSMPLLEDQPFSEWWMHGQVGCQGEAKEAFVLPAMSSTKMAMSSRYTEVGPPWSDGKFAPADPNKVLSREEWLVNNNGNSLNGNHNIHADTRDDPSGCALAIAYKSDVKKVKPEDFVVFTVVHDCPKRQLEKVDVPDLPACPDGKCICAWFWIPKNSGLKNFYMTVRAACRAPANTH